MDGQRGGSRRTFPVEVPGTRPCDESSLSASADGASKCVGVVGKAGSVLAGPLAFPCHDDRSEASGTSKSWRIWTPAGYKLAADRSQPVTVPGAGLDGGVRAKQGSRSSGQTRLLTRSWAQTLLRDGRNVCYIMSKIAKILE